MGRSRAKKQRQAVETSVGADEGFGDVIKNLPKKQLVMRVNSGTKMRNVLSFAQRKFDEFDCLLWTGAGGALGKVTSCAEVFKRNYKGLHQITKLRYIESKNQGKEGSKRSQVPEITICLTKFALNKNETGYQGPDDDGLFQNLERDSARDPQPSTISGVAAEEFAKMGLRTGQKRQRGGERGRGEAKRAKEEEN